jgi:hypothetical protein
MSRLTNLRQIRWTETLANPIARGEEVADPVARAFAVRMEIDQARGAAGHGDYIVRTRTGFEAGRDQFCLDVNQAGYRFMAMIGSCNQQDIIAGRA